MALDYTGISGYKHPHDCGICTKTKITVSKDQRSLRSASEFAEAINMDLVGSQKSLSPVATDTLVTNPTWFLLAVDENTSWKWAWPIFSEKSVPTRIRYFLEHLKNIHNVTSKWLYTNSGTEFANSELQKELLTRGIEWHKSSSYAPE